MCRALAMRTRIVPDCPRWQSSLRHHFLTGEHSHLGGPHRNYPESRRSMRRSRPSDCTRFRRLAAQLSAPLRADTGSDGKADDIQVNHCSYTTSGVRTLACVFRAIVEIARPAASLQSSVPWLSFSRLYVCLARKQVTQCASSTHPRKSFECILSCTHQAPPVTLPMIRMVGLELFSLLE